MKKINVLITAGPTREYIDPVRFISNESSGRMGYSLAEIINMDKNTNVTLIAGPTAISPPHNIKTIRILSAEQMYAQVLKYYRNSDILIFTAAVGDWKPKKFSVHKIKKNSNHLDIEFVPNPDISLKISKKIDNTRKVLVGFALESKNHINNAYRKLKLKKLDLIVANTLNTIGKNKLEGFIIDRTKEIIKVGKMEKKKFSKLLWSIIKKRYSEKLKLIDLL